MPDLDAALDRIRAFSSASLPSFLDAPGADRSRLTDRDGLLGVLPVGKADAASPARRSTEETRFEIGSISKSFAALIALQEVERGTLDLSAPVTEYVPWFRVRSEFGSAYGPITTHHLLTHTSGLIMGMDFADDAIPAVESLARTSTGFPPGERFLDSNDGYKLVGLILEHVTGSTIRELLSRAGVRPGRACAGAIPRSRSSRGRTSRRAINGSIARTVRRTGEMPLRPGPADRQHDRGRQHHLHGGRHGRVRADAAQPRRTDAGATL